MEGNPFADITIRNDIARDLVAGFAAVTPDLAGVWRYVDRALADVPATLAELGRVRGELKAVRLNRANLLAAIRATLGAHQDGEETRSATCAPTRLTRPAGLGYAEVRMTRLSADAQARTPLPPQRPAADHGHQRRQPVFYPGRAVGSWPAGHGATAPNWPPPSRQVQCSGGLVVARRTPSLVALSPGRPGRDRMDAGHVRHGSASPGSPRTDLPRLWLPSAQARGSRSRACLARHLTAPEILSMWRVHPRNPVVDPPTPPRQGPRRAHPRRLADIIAAVGLPGSRVMSAVVDRWGWRARIGLPPGQTTTDLINASPALESGLRTRPGAVRVEPDPYAGRPRPRPGPEHRSARPTAALPGPGPTRPAGPSPSRSRSACSKTPTRDGRGSRTGTGCSAGSPAPGRAASSTSSSPNSSPAPMSCSGASTSRAAWSYARGRPASTGSPPPPRKRRRCLPTPSPSSRPAPRRLAADGSRAGQPTAAAARADRRYRRVRRTRRRVAPPRPGTPTPSPAAAGPSPSRCSPRPSGPPRRPWAPAPSARRWTSGSACASANAATSTSSSARACSPPAGPPTPSTPPASSSSPPPNTPPPTRPRLPRHTTTTSPAPPAHFTASRPQLDDVSRGAILDHPAEPTASTAPATLRTTRARPASVADSQT